MPFAEQNPLVSDAGSSAQTLKLEALIMNLWTLITNDTRQDTRELDPWHSQSAGQM
jgi:hypothetical protein